MLVVRVREARRAVGKPMSEGVGNLASGWQGRVLERLGGLWWGMRLEIALLGGNGVVVRLWLCTGGL